MHALPLITPEIAQAAILSASPTACQHINEFARQVLHTRGGRVGSGMGTLIEALWGYYTNQVLAQAGAGAQQCELAWIPGHQYHDFACVLCSAPWDHQTHVGELLCVEAKSMVMSADESKAHFDELEARISSLDLMVVIAWDWKPIDEAAIRVCPDIIDHFIGPARNIAHLRDRLHLARGGVFVDRAHCPDGCDPAACPHGGEPLNASGKRERLSGPESTRVSAKVSYAANFGGMVRMLKTDSEAARAELRAARREDDVAHAYISFVHRNLPGEELSQYTTAEWRHLAQTLAMKDLSGRKADLARRIRVEFPDYQDALRHI